MKRLRQFGRAVFFTIIGCLLLGSMGFLCAGFIDYVLVGVPTNEPLWNLAIGVELAVLAGIVAWIPRSNRAQARFRQEQHERFRASLRKGCRNWAAARGIVLTEADAIGFVDALYAQAKLDGVHRRLD